MKRSLTFIYFAILLHSLFFSNSYSQGDEQFRSRSTGIWNVTANWEMSTNNGATWINATSTPDASSDMITIRAPHLISVTVNVTVDQLFINNGGILVITSSTILTISDGIGSDLNLNSGGIIRGSGEVRAQPSSTFTNNGMVDVDFNFGNMSILQGTGSWSSSANILPGSTLTLGSNHQMSSVSIQSGATFNISSRTLKLSAAGGVPLDNNGTVITTNSTIEYNATSDQQLATLTYNILTLSGTGIKSMNGSFTVNNSLNLLGGSLGIGTNTLTINGVITQTSGTLSGGTASNLTIGGSTGAAVSLPSVSLNNFTLSRINGINLTGDITINGVLNWVSGRINILTNNLTFGSSASITTVGIPNLSKMIVASSSGTVRKNFTGTGTRTFSFPVGDNDSIPEYSPIFLTINGSFGTGAYVAVNLKNVKHPNNMSPTDYIKRYWTVTQNAITSFSCTIIGEYVDADIVGNELSMWTGGWNDSSWTLLSQVDALNNEIRGTVSSFSDFTGGNKRDMGGTINTFFSSGNYSDTSKWSDRILPLTNDSIAISANCFVDIQIPLLGSLNINNGIILDLSTFSLPSIQKITNNGTIKTQNTSATPLPSGRTYTGTIEYYAIGSQSVVNSTYSNLTISGSGNKIMKGSFPVLNLLNLFGGYLVIDSSTLTLNDSINFAGGSLKGGTTSSLNINGFRSEISLPLLTLKNLILNRANGVKLNDSLFVYGTLKLVSGDVTLNGMIITLDSAATLAESTGNNVKGNSGYIVTTRTLNNISSKNVGGLGAVITTSQNMGLTEIRRGHSQQTIDGNPGILRYYDIYPSNDSMLNATLVFNYDESELNGLSESSLSLFQSETRPCFTYIERHGTRDTINNNITLSGINSFSRWTAASSTGSLPFTNNVMESPKDFIMTQNFPNPFNSQTRINYLIPENGIVKMNIYDLSGREIAVIVNKENQLSGFHSVQFEGSNFASGIYFYKLEFIGASNKFIKTRRMIILK